MSQTSPQTLSPRRIQERKLVEEGQIRVPIELIKSQRQIEIRIQDISKRGLGFFADLYLEPGIYSIRMLGVEINCELTYCNNHLGIENLFRCGFFVRDSDVNLSDLIERKMPRAS